MSSKLELLLIKKKEEKKKKETKKIIQACHTLENFSEHTSDTEPEYMNKS